MQALLPLQGCLAAVSKAQVTCHQHLCTALRTTIHGRCACWTHQVQLQIQSDTPCLWPAWACRARTCKAGMHLMCSCCRAPTYASSYAGHLCEGRWVISWVGDAAQSSVALRSLGHPDGQPAGLVCDAVADWEGDQAAVDCHGHNLEEDADVVHQHARFAMLAKCMRADPEA